MEERKDVVCQIVENLRGAALNVAVDIGIEELYGENGLEKLMGQLVAYNFPITRHAMKHMHSDGAYIPTTVCSYGRVVSQCSCTLCVAGAG